MPDVTLEVLPQGLCPLKAQLHAETVECTCQTSDAAFLQSLVRQVL